MNVIKAGLVLINKICFEDTRLVMIVILKNSYNDTNGNLQKMNGIITVVGSSTQIASKAIGSR